MSTDKSTSLMPRRRKLCIGGFLVMIIVLLYFSITIKMEGPQLSQEGRTKWKEERLKQLPQENKAQYNGSAIQKDLEFLHSSLTKLRQNGSASVDTLLEKIEDMIDSLKIPSQSETHNESEQIEVSKPPVELLDVCPEKYMGSKYGYMYFVTGWVTENCTNVKPIENVVSIVINPHIVNSSQCPDNLERVIARIRAAYEKVNIFVPDYSVTSCSPQLINASVSKVHVDRGWKPGRKWNALVKSVSTPYVFIARDLDYFVDWLTRLERQ